MAALVLSVAGGALGAVFGPVGAIDGPETNGDAAGRGDEDRDIAPGGATSRDSDVADDGARRASREGETLP